MRPNSVSQREFARRDLSVTLPLPIPASDIQKCRAGDSDCISAIITDVVGRVGNGHPGLNLPPIDPLHVKAINIAQGAESPVSIKLDLMEQDLIGLKDIKVHSVRGFETNPEGQVFSVNATAPQVQLVGNYKINGRVLVLPIQGQGRSNLTLENVKINLKYITQSIQKNNKLYIQAKKFRFSFETNRLHIFLENLFNGDKRLSDNMNLFLNENWRDILHELKPSIEDAFSQIIGSLVNTVYARIAYSDFYLLE